MLESNTAKDVLLFVVIALGIILAVIVVDNGIAHPWILFGDSLGVVTAVMTVIHLPWLLVSKESPILILVAGVLKAVAARVLKAPDILTSQRLKAQYGFRLLGVLLICAAAPLFAWLAEACFSVPLKVIYSPDAWLPSHAWSFGVASAGVSIWITANLIPALRGTLHN